jgi:tetratricopeptide (TPR) repeat protein
MGQKFGIIEKLTCAVFLMAALLLAGCTSAPSSTSGITQSTNKSALNEKYRSDYTEALNALEAKKYSQASDALIRIMANNPGFIEGWANLALAQLRKGDIPQARQSANNALQLEPQSAPLENLSGLISLEEGAYKAAEQHYARALQLNPNLANAHYNLALLNDIYYQNIAKAIQHYERYLALINNADPDTEAWVEELKRNLK